MDRQQHLAHQAAGSIDEYAGCLTSGKPVDPVDVAVMAINTWAARVAGVHPMHINAYRRTAPA